MISSTGLQLTDPAKTKKLIWTVKRFGYTFNQWRMSLHRVKRQNAIQ